MDAGHYTEIQVFTIAMLKHDYFAIVVLNNFPQRPCVLKTFVKKMGCRLSLGE